MKQTLHKFYCSLFTLLAAVFALQASATPQVEALLKEVTANTVTITFTPNSEVKEYYLCVFDHGGMEATYEEFKWMNLYDSYASMIKVWGKEAYTKVSTKMWKDLAPDTEFDFCVVSYDAAGVAAPIQTFTYKTLVKGGDGPSVINIEIKEFTQNQGVYLQRIVCTANDQTARFYSQPWPEVRKDDDGVEHHYNVADAKEYLFSLYDDPNARDSYAAYDVDDWQWQLEPATKYHATAMGMNAKGEWGEMTDLVFTTPGYIDPTAASFWWGYGDGSSISGSYGPSSVFTCTAAIKIPANVLAAYDGATISDLRFAVNGDCTNVSYFVMQGKSEDGDANYALLKTYADHAVAVGNLSNGWHEFALETPVTIHAGEDVYIGYTATGLRPIALAADKGSEGTCIMNSGKKFYDYGTMEGMEYTLACQAKINSANVKAAVELAPIGDLNVEIGKPYEVTGTVTTLTPVAVTSYIAQLKVDGKAVKQSTIKCDMPTKDSSSTFTLKAGSGLTLGEHTYSVSILALNGEILDEAVVCEGTITAHEMYLTRRHVFEDVTGTNCPWCPRATAGLEAMKQTYPNEVIVIGVHKEDSYEIADYSSLTSVTSSRPTVYINREDKCGSGYYAEDVAYFETHKQKEIKGECKFVVAQYTDASRSKVALIVDSRFAKDYDEHGFSLGFVVTEDDIPAYQYSDSSLGPSGMVDLQDVARCYKGANGSIAGSFPAQLKAGEHYYYRYDLPFPTNVQNRNNCNIIVLLQSKQASRAGIFIANADIISKIAEPGTYDLEGMDTVLAPGVAPSAIFDLSGRRISAPQRGQISVQNGRKQIM